MRVFVHSGKGKTAKNQGYQFVQIPAVGEFISPDPAAPDMTVYRVDFVLHCPFNFKKKGSRIYDAEIWVSDFYMPDALKRAGALQS